MVHIIEGSSRRELLPFPILITQLLEDHEVDIKCAKYDFGLGSIDGITLAKSISTLKTYGQVKGHTGEATSSAPPHPREHQGHSGSEEVVTMRQLHREMRTFKEKVDHRLKKIENGLKKIFDLLGCKSDDAVPGATIPSSSHAPTPRDDDDSQDDE